MVWIRSEKNLHVSIIGRESKTFWSILSSFGSRSEEAWRGDLWFSSRFHPFLCARPYFSMIKIVSSISTEYLMVATIYFSIDYTREIYSRFFVFVFISRTITGDRIWFTAFGFLLLPTTGATPMVMWLFWWHPRSWARCLRSSESFPLNHGLRPHHFRYWAPLYCLYGQSNFARFIDVYWGLFQFNWIFFTWMKLHCRTCRISHRLRTRHNLIMRN